ncbi:unnamed protein product [Toxocara canis]|uniref:GNAT family N-acetyltransferase n=1 Tax=Toxocara canis TaxID=6265 RepID=A0A183V5L3_TOXCA|nr:unnamed protein product [Toxocara canis]
MVETFVCEDDFLPAGVADLPHGLCFMHPHYFGSIDMMRSLGLQRKGLPRFMGSRVAGIGRYAYLFLNEPN